jgi:hypothetical protein
MVTLCDATTSLFPVGPIGMFEREVPLSVALTFLPPLRVLTPPDSEIFFFSELLFAIFSELLFA